MIETLASLAQGAGVSLPVVPDRRDDPSQAPGSSLENPRTSWDRIFETRQVYSGVPVNELSSLQVAAVWRCVSIIAGTLARTPFSPYTRSLKGKELNREHYLWPLFAQRANPFMSAYRFKRLMQTRVCLWGNAYALIEENGRGQIMNLWPLRSDRTTPKVAFNPDGSIKGVLYEVISQSGTIQRFPYWQILHLRGLETDGLKGLSPISSARQSVGLAIAAEEYGARYFGQGVHMGGWVGHPQPLSPTAKQNISATLNDLYGGLRGSHKIGVLEEGMEYHEVGIPPEDMQFLQTRQFQAIDIARLFGVPPHMIAELSRATFSNIEHQSIEFVRSCMGDWFANWENECSTQLLSERESRTVELSFYQANLLAGDRESRFRTYSLGRANTILSTNECREMEGLNRIEEPWADDYLQPLNMVVAGEGLADSEDPEVIDDPDDAGPGENDPLQRPAKMPPGITPPADKPKPPAPGAAPKQKPKPQPQGRMMRFLLLPFNGGKHARDRATLNPHQ